MFQDVENDHVTVYPRFNASRSEPNSENITLMKEDGEIKGISLVCQVCDEICEVGSFPNRSSSHEVPLWETDSWPVEWLVELLRLTYCSHRGYGGFGDRLVAAARTSIGGVTHGKSGRLARVADESFEALVLLYKGMHLIRDHRIRWAVKQHLASCAVEVWERAPGVRDRKLSQEILGKCLGRIPSITTKGKLVLSSEYVRQGDVVTVIKGAQVPFILRRQSSGSYQLISEAYVDGIMDGEATDTTQYQRLNFI
jgi:hypothetical protein